MIRVHPTAPEPAGGDADGGFTLIETLVALILLGLVFIVVMGSIVTATRITHDNRARAEADKYGRTLAERIKGVEDDPSSNPHYAYKACAIPADYSGLVAAASDGYRVVVEKVEYWVRSSGSTATDTYTSSCMPNTSTTPSTDSGIQRITVRAEPPIRAYRSGATVVRVVVIKRDTRGDCHSSVQPLGVQPCKP